MNNQHSAFRVVPKTGVIYVMDRASQLGYEAGNGEWANLGQGAAEAGLIPECVDRLTHIPHSIQTSEYCGVIGTKALRTKVAELYNHRYRRGQKSQYTYENVAISSGGRAGLARIAAALGEINLGHFIPDYTAYEELLDLFRKIRPIPIMLTSDHGFKATPELLRDRILGLGLGAVLLSNPCNPTGNVICGDELAQIIETFKELNCCMILDEFYSHYHYDQETHAQPVSAAAFVQDVNKDQVILVDGLSKNWRYPGLRVSWTIAPKNVIEAISAVASFMDGGSNHPVQNSVIPLLEPQIADQEMHAIQKHFKEKRDYTLQRLQDMGFKLPNVPQGGFYAFAALDQLPEGLQRGRDFFEQALQQKVICVPGEFFDVDPGKRRMHIPSRLDNYVRISYGPPLTEVERGLNAIEKMVTNA